MKTNEINKRINEVRLQSGYNLGWKLFKYKNSRIVKSIVQNISELNNKDLWAKGLYKGFDDAHSKSSDKQKRLSELDVIFKDREKENEKDLER